MNDVKEKNTPDLLSMEETCALLEISRPTAYQRIREGVLVPVKQSAIKRIRKLYFPRAHVEALAAPTEIVLRGKGRTAK